MRRYADGRTPEEILDALVTLPPAQILDLAPLRFAAAHNEEALQLLGRVEAARLQQLREAPIL